MRRINTDYPVLIRRIGENRCFLLSSALELPYPGDQGGYEMKEFEIRHEEALRVLKQWQENTRPVEVRLRYNLGMIQSHSGSVTVEPEGQVVVAQVADSDFFFSNSPRRIHEACRRRLLALKLQ